MQNLKSAIPAILVAAMVFGLPVQHVTAKDNLTAAQPATSAATRIAGTSTDGINTSKGIYERQLRELSEAMHHAKHAAGDLSLECQRDAGLSDSAIDFIGTESVPLVPDFGGNTMLPPRPKYLTMHLSQLQSAMPLVQDAIDSLKAPNAAVASRLEPFTAEIKSVWHDAQKQSAALTPLCTTPPFDTKAIIKTAAALNADFASIEQLKGEMYKEYKKNSVIDVIEPKAQP